MVLTRRGWRVMSVLLDDDRLRLTVEHELSNRLASEASFDEAIPLDIETLDGFEDCHWLFSSNGLNHGLSRLEFDEAAYLFRLARRLDRPTCVEIGRYRGGSTFLLAAAGAEVLSIDIDASMYARDAMSIVNALERFGLREQVQLVLADSRLYPASPNSVDVLFVDGAHSYEGVRADFEHWWHAVRPGGHLLLHDVDFPDVDPRRAVTIGVKRLATEVAARDDVRQHRAAGSFAHFSKVRDGTVRKPERRPGSTRARARP